MIGIVNVSKTVKPFGIHHYEVRINSEVVATFTHKREEGLARCLQLAAAAVEAAKWGKYYEVLKESPAPKVKFRKERVR